MRVHIRETATNRILPEDETPKPDEVETWLETHPGHEVLPRDQLSDDSDSDNDAPIPTEDVVNPEPDEYAGMDEEAKAKAIIEKVSLFFSFHFIV